MEDAPPLTRRALRARAAQQAASKPEQAATPSEHDASEAATPTPAPVPAAEGPVRAAREALLPFPVPAEDPAEAPSGPVRRRSTHTDASAEAAEPSTATAALAWVDPDAVRPELPDSSDQFELLPERVRRRIRTRTLLAPVGAAAGLALAYTATMALWPLSAVSPTTTMADLAPLQAPASQIEWPAEGSAAVGLTGFTSAASTSDPDRIASITKLVTALVVLDALPLEVGESGPAYEFTAADRREYWAYIEDDRSALNVPDDGSLTEYQLLQGLLIGSAGNYADRLVEDQWGSVREYTRAANAWLRTNGIDGITIADASGISRDNQATPRALIALAKKALQHPVVAEIVATPSVVLPGAGLVENTNSLLLEDPSVVGLKTGSYAEAYALLTAREAVIDGDEITLYATVTGQPDDDARDGEARRLLDALEAEASTPHTVPAGTVVGSAATAWGTTADIVTAADARVLLWNGAAAKPTVEVSLGDERAAGAEVGTLTATGPVDRASVGLTLAGDLGGPDLWWRLSHPLELLGLVD